MRLSPVLVAVLAASATLNLAHPAQGQTLTPVPTAVGESVTESTVSERSDNPQADNPQAVPSTPVETIATSELTFSEPESTGEIVVATPELNAIAVPTAEVTVPTQAAPETFPPAFLTQAPASDPTDSSPPATPTIPQGTPTPTQETPNQIEVPLTPGTPGIDLELPNQNAPTPVRPDAGAETATPEPRVLVAEVAVSGVDQELQDIVYQAIRTRPGVTTTRTQLQEDINAIFATGFFARVRAQPEDTPLGVRITFEVQPNPVLTSVRVEGNKVLPQTVITEAFQEQVGTRLNLRRFQDGIKRLNQWYQDNGYVLAQVIDAPQVGEDGTVTLQVAEGVIEDVQVRFLNKEGEETNAQGQPIRGRTREFIITREFTLKKGDIFNRTQAETDLRRAFGLGIFEDVRLSLNPGQDPRQVVVVINTIERNTGSLAAGLGISSASGLFGTVSYQEQNLGGNNQKLGAEVQVGQRELLFDINFTDPWIAGDPYRTSYTVNIFNRRSISLIFDGGERDVTLSDGSRPRIDRLGGGVTFTRPLQSGWTASLGLQYQQVSVRDFRRRVRAEDELGNQLSFSGTGIDTLLTVQFGAVRDLRDDPLKPTRGSVLRFGTEQSIPIGSGNILFNRVRGSYSYYIPVQFTRFNPGPQALAFNIQGGYVLGDLPPYEAFALGGSNSVRGYDEGDVGSGRGYVQATAEYRFPILNVVGGALFADFATDFGTGRTVPGDPAGARRKPGSGVGVGAGLRVQTPLGPLRLDYGFNDQGDSRLHFGIGERF